MNNCIFCKIINGEVDSDTIYEDDVVKVFLDVNQDCVGHSLVIPKEHYVTIDELPVDVLNHIMSVTVKMYNLFKERLNIDGMTLLQNNGIAQEVKHFHLHLLPKYNSRPNLSKEEVKEKLK